MDIAIISSLKDPASVNIKDNLINNFDFKQLEEKFDDNNIYQLNLNNKTNSINEKNNEKNINKNSIKKFGKNNDSTNDNIKIINKNNQINNKINLTNKDNNENNSIKKINKNLTINDDDNDDIKNKNNSIDKKNNNKIIRLYTINSELIFADDLDKKIDADVFVFISKHRAEEGRASLTCHAIGNFGNADFGGKEKTICKSPSFLLKNIFVELNKNVENTEYEATLEATHHGPFMEKPLLFVELGSNEKYWNDKNGGEIVSKSLMSAIKKSNLNFNNNNNLISNNQNSIIEKTINENNEKINSINKKRINKKLNNENVFNNNELNNDELNNGKNKNSINGNNKLKINEDYESTLVIGGSHYSHVGNKTMLLSHIAIGHICPKYNFANLNEEMLKQAISKVIPKPKFVLLDWKGLGKEKQRILAMLKKNNIKYERSDKFFE